MSKLSLIVVSQEKELFNSEVERVTAPASEGEITILASHIPLFTKLSAGELVYQQATTIGSIVVSKGFLSLDNEGRITVMVDSAVHARDISLNLAQKAIKDAETTLQKAQTQHELVMAEASLRLAMLEMKVAQKTSKSKI